MLENLFEPKSDIEKDINNPIRRVIRHTVLKKKYGDMQHHYMAATNYLIEQFKPFNIDEVIAESTEKMDKYLAYKASIKTKQKQTQATSESAAAVDSAMQKDADGLYHYKPVIIHDGGENM